MGGREDPDYPNSQCAVPEPSVLPTAPSTLSGPRVSHSSSENSDAKLVALTASATLDFSVYSITWPRVSRIVIILCDFTGN